MSLKSLRYFNFRNFHDLAITDLGRESNVVIEQNGRGKSNLLEGIFLLGTGFSPRTAKTKECIRWGERLARIECTLTSGDRLAVVITTTGKKFYLNDKGVEYRSFLGRLQVVHFQPSDLNLLSGSPSLRRTFLNRLIAQLDFEYVYYLSKYNRLLAKRNALLRVKNNNADVFEIIEAEMSHLAEQIYKKRNQTFTKINELLVREDLKTNYKISPESLREYCGENAGILAEKMREKMRGLREKEMGIGYTIMGPQRDDFNIFLNDHERPDSFDLGMYGSRGQQRMALYELLKCESIFIEQVFGEKPVFLLDDVFSELDNVNQKKLLKEFDSHQSVVVSTDKSVIPAFFPRNPRILLPVK